MFYDIFFVFLKRRRRPSNICLTGIASIGTYSCLSAAKISKKCDIAFSDNMKRPPVCY